MTDNDPDLQQRVRLFIFEHFLDHAAPPVVEQVMTEFSLSRAAATEMLKDLEAAHHIALVKGTARILMAFPFSAIATPFRTTVRGRSYFANCAWDAIAFHAMLGDEVRVESFCHHCATPFEIELLHGRASRVDPPESLVYFARPPTEWWDDITTTCGNTMVFFVSPEHRDASDLCAGADQSASLTPDQVNTLSVPSYSTKFSLDYTRPSKDVLLAHWAAMGLTGDFWKL
ncbi:MAG: organomercurial lyase [Chloroflexota bacterium]